MSRVLWSGGGLLLFPSFLFLRTCDKPKKHREVDLEGLVSTQDNSTHTAETEK